MRKELIIVGVAALLVLSSVGIIYRKQAVTAEQEEELSSLTKAVLVAAEDVDELLRDEKVFLLDVHIPEQTHIPGTDAVIPYNEISNYEDKLPADKNVPILVYCRSGSMSAEAGRELARMGYTSIYDLAGGINAYKEAQEIVGIYPDSRDLGVVAYGEVARTEFTLTNFTPQLLKITRVSTSCGCTKAEAEQTELQPYKSTAVKVLFDPAVHGEDSDMGDLTREIYISTDNSDFARVTAQISVNVVRQ